MDYKTGGRINHKEKWYKISVSHIYRILRKWGFKQKVPRKVHVNTASHRGKRGFQKKAEQILVDKQQQQQQEQEQDRFTKVSIDESFLFYDSLVRRVWIDEKKRPNSQSNRFTSTFMHL